MQEDLAKGMMSTTLYEELGVLADCEDPGRTVRTANHETIDRDWSRDSLLVALAVSATGAQDSRRDPSRTDETKAQETIDRDRHQLLMSAKAIGGRRTAAHRD